VELLSAIAIVALLAALLVPAVRGGLERAGAAKCLRNLGDLQRVNLVFANDNNGDFMPAWANNSSGGLSKLWYDQSLFISLLGIPAGPYGTVNWPASRLCPQAEIAQRLARNTPPNNAMGRCYGYNIEGNDVNWGTPGAGNAIRNVRVARPASTIAFADALDWVINASGSGAYNGKEERVQPKMIAYRHNGFANVVFFDGHAERLPRAALDTTMNPENITKWSITK
jgi:prepilin-type processing-associated H-X9-DG protein